MKHVFQAVADIARRYAHALKVSWKARRFLDPLSRNQDELAFQPAIIELADNPGSPAPRMALRMIVALFTIGLVWASLGKLEIVAVASGKIVTDTRTKTVQAIETAIVRRILVSDGQLVKKGQLLLELDAVGVRSDMDRAGHALATAQLNVVRTAAQVSAMERGSLPPFEAPPGTSTVEAVDARKLAASEYETFRRKVDSLRSVIQQKQAERHTVELTIGPLREYAQIAADRVADYKRLLGKNYVSRQEYLMREQERINAQRDFVSQQNRMVELAAAIEVAAQQLSATEGDTRRSWLDAGRQASDQVRQLASDVAKSQERQSSMRLTSPVDGTVQQLAVHTAGGVVTPAQPLMSIVPSGESVEVEATVLNEDIGFVRPGQSVVAKVQSFPYTRYGYVTASVLSVSHDAVNDEKLGLVFPARIKLDRSTMDIDGAVVSLSPGMALSLEIATGERTVLQYFLEPLEIHVDESLHER
jgi:hemolysin D